MFCRLRTVVTWGALCLMFSAISPPPARADESGSGREALVQLLAAQHDAPDSQDAAKALEHFVCRGLPDELPAGDLAGLPADIQTLPDGLGTLVVPKPYLAVSAIEPQKLEKFPKISYLYLPDSSGHNGGRLFCRVHYTSRDDTRFANRVAGLLALAHRTLTTETGHEAANGTDAFDVWLSPQGRGGGEQWRTNLYLYDIAAPRSSIEWIREIVHEYSHLAIPAIGGYKAPEYWANGYLGERLIVRWLQRMPGGPTLVTRVWGDFSGAANFDRLLIAPAIESYRRIGPKTQWLTRTDEAGMRYFIGQVLVLDDKYGAKVLGDLLDRLPRFHEAHPADLVASLPWVLKQHTQAKL